MPSLLSLLVASLSLASISISQAVPKPSPTLHGQVGPAAFNFQELLEALPEESLHAALHKHLDGKFTDGAFEHDRDAVYAVHDEDAPTATKVLAEAALDLIRRQNSNSTAVAATSSVPLTSTTRTTDGSTVVAPATSVSTTATTPAPVIVTSLTLTTTDSAGSATVVTTSAVVAASVSKEVTVTTTDSSGSTVTQATSVAAQVVTSNGQPTTVTASTVNIAAPQTISTTDNAGNSVVLTGAVAGATLTATDARGSTFITTYTPGGGVVQSLVLETTYLPDGQLTTITSFAVVEQQTATASAASASSSPKLQNGADSMKSRGMGAEAVVMMGGALGMALLL
ncbi:hypothetical protein E6O75_ATG05871 [Venturia nashicola]|uniref:Uncharacterized protein n=1 Tax=Venturia nashicola TaxID=86259 RepID=A0A4Z1P3V9_9PEZI|nr:hypothetical protein E6O75_ATG05871 [Venturia nashicola]